jgi:hypothetical protein
MATLTGFEPIFEISRYCAISPQICARLRVTREDANRPVCANRAELRISTVRICPKTFSDCARRSAGPSDCFTSVLKIRNQVTVKHALYRFIWICCLFGDRRSGGVSLRFPSRIRATCRRSIPAAVPFAAKLLACTLHVGSRLTENTYQIV